MNVAAKFAARITPSTNATIACSRESSTRTCMPNIIGKRQTGAMAKRNAAKVSGPAYANAILAATQL